MRDDDPYERNRHPYLRAILRGVWRWAAPSGPGADRMVAAVSEERTMGEREALEVQAVCFRLLDHVQNVKPMEPDALRRDINFAAQHLLAAAGPRIPAGPFDTIITAIEQRIAREHEAAQASPGLAEIHGARADALALALVDVRAIREEMP